MNNVPNNRNYIPTWVYRLLFSGNALDVCRGACSRATTAHHTGEGEPAIMILKPGVI